MSSDTLTTPPKRYTAYDPWAWLYNQSLGPRYCADQLPILEHLLLPQLSTTARLLDLCCGTGQITQQLLANGYQVTGLDGSEAMLHYAQDNAPDGEFILEDARSFQLPATFDAVFSTSASLNHMMSLADLERVFRNVYAALRPDGIFLFDLRLKGNYRNLAIAGGEVQEEYAWAVGERYDPVSETGAFKITIFHLDNGVWQRSDLTYHTKDYTWAEIQTALEKTGFRDLCIHDRNGELATPENNQLVYFMGRK